MSGQSTLRLELPVITGAATHVGLVRSVNEDNLAVIAQAGLWCVADGVGGLDSGSLASAIVAEAMQGVHPQADLAALVDTVGGAVETANRRVRQVIAERAGQMMGSTVAALMVHGGNFAALWSGDSRVYRVSDGGIAQVTRDHTEAQELIESGMLTIEQARAWPRRNVITQAVGVSEAATFDIERGEAAAGDRFVLCSDGLTNHVTDEEIRDTVLRTTPQTACDDLIRMTLERGATDNVTVIVVHVKATNVQAASQQTIAANATAAAGGS
jgi:serine/threonine protein phosphatase PrpC